MSKILQILTELTIIDILTIKKTNIKLNWFDSFTDILNPKNIQQLLIDLDLGKSTQWLSIIDFANNTPDDLSSIQDFAQTDVTLAKLLTRFQNNIKVIIPKTQAKALSDDWFSLTEKDGKPSPSLWNSGEDGQIQVLTELKGILESYLQTNL